MRSLVGRPGHVLGLHDRLGRTDERGRADVPPAIEGDAREPADRERPRELVADPLADLQRLAVEGLGFVEVAELPLDHAEVGRLRRDQELVVGPADERQPLRHPVTGLQQVAGDLGADPEEVQGIRATRLVAGRGADVESLVAEASSFGHVRSKGDAGQAAERLGRQLAHRRAAARRRAPGRTAPTLVRHRPSRTA